MNEEEAWKVADHVRKVNAGVRFVNCHGVQYDRIDNYDGTITLGKKCFVTGTYYSVRCSKEGVEKWMQGGMIQDSLKDLSASDREFLMSGTTKEGWTKTFGLDEEQIRKLMEIPLRDLNRIIIDEEECVARGLKLCMQADGTQEGTPLWDERHAQYEEIVDEIVHEGPDDLEDDFNL